jgi:hypothetical protein
MTIRKRKNNDDSSFTSLEKNGYSRAGIRIICSFTITCRNEYLQINTTFEL